MARVKPVKKQIYDCRALAPMGLLAICFLLGIYLGWYYSQHISAAASDEVQDFVEGYFMISPQYQLSVSRFLHTFFIYLRYPLLVFLLGFASFGLLLIPALTVALAFSLAFSTCCFAAALGRRGVLIAAVAFGLRCLFTLPCFLFAAQRALHTSNELACYAFGAGKRGVPLFDTGVLYRVLLFLVVLAAGALIELCIVPWLLSLIYPV